MKKKQSIEELQKELDALMPQARGQKQAPIPQPTQEEQKPNLDDPAYCEDLEKYPVTAAEQNKFDDAVAALNRRRYALASDTGLDDLETWVKWDRKVQRMFRTLDD